MDGGCISIWVKKQLTLNQRLLLQKYEYFLMDYKMGYSFSYEFREPKFSSKYEKKQVESALGYVPGQEILICGLADPMFRSAAAIMKHFCGYYQTPIDDETEPYLKGDYHVIRKRNKLGISKYDYHLVDWQFVTGYFNQLDDVKMKNLYSIERFEKNEFERLWRSKPNYGISIN